MKRVFIACLLSLLSLTAHAQVRQSGNVTPGHSACWAITGVIYDCGLPSGSSIVGSYSANDLLAADGSGSIVSSGINPVSGGTWVGLQNFNGGATAPTQANGNNSTNVATTAFVQNAFASPPTFGSIFIDLTTLGLGGTFGMTSFALQTEQLFAGQTAALTQATNANTFLLQESITVGAHTLDGWAFVHDVLGGNGQRNGVQIVLDVPANSTWSGISGGGVTAQLTALEVSAFGRVNVGGLSSVASAGNLFAFSPECFLTNGATFWSSLDCAEFNVSVAAGASVSYLTALKIAQQNDHAVHAAINEAGLTFTAVGTSAVGWNCLICAGIYVIGNGSPFGGNGTVANGGTYLGLFNGVTFKNGIDFSGAGPTGTDLTTGSPFKSGAFYMGVSQTTYQVDWYGDVIASEITGSGWSNVAGALTPSNYLTIISPATAGTAITLGNSTDPTVAFRGANFKWKDFADAVTFADYNVTSSGKWTFGASTTFSTGTVTMPDGGTWTSSLLTGNNVTFGGLFRLTYGTPTIASGACGTGTNGAITGNNQNGLVTIGAAGTTTCTISFSVTVANAPNACVLFPANATAAATGTTVARVSSISTGGFVITGGALASSNYYYLCI